MISEKPISRHLEQVLNSKFSCSFPTLELTEITVHAFEDISSTDISLSVYFYDAVGDMILFPKQIFDQKKIKSFNNNNQCEVQQKHSTHPIICTFIKKDK